MDSKPKLRPVEVFPVESEQGTMVCLRDATGISDRVVTASPQVVAVLRLLDGNNSVADIQADLMRRMGGRMVRSEDIRRILDVLDEAMLLEGERFEAHAAAMLKEFADSPVRKAMSAGNSYPEEATHLANFLDEILGNAAKATGGGTTLRGLIAPHIDHVRGRKTYALAYGALARTQMADLYVVLGTAHAESEERIVLTRKDFETPLGVTATDKEFVDALAKRAGRNLFADEFVHRAEHSIELEVVFLQHLALKQKREIKVVPILCGSFRDAFETGKLPMELPGVKEVVEGLRELIGKEHRRVTVLAGVDFAHVGPQFGGEDPVSDAMLGALESADRETLALVEKGDADAFFKHIAADGNARNICGVAATYITLKVLEPCTPNLLGYEQWYDDEGTGCVTFAAATIS